MKNRLLYLAIIIIASGNLCAQQQITDANKIDMIKTELADTYKKIASIECNYFMEKSSPLLQDKTIGEGHVRYHKSDPSELFWESTKPSQSSFRMFNDSIEVNSRYGMQKMPIENHVIFKEVAQIVKGSVEYGSMIDENSFYADYFSDGSNLIVKLTPMKNKQRMMFKSIDVVMDGKTKEFKEIDIIDGMGNTMNITLTDAIVKLTK